MSVQALSWVLAHSPAEGAPRLVLISLANHASSDGADSYPSVETIRREACLKSRRTVQNALSKLVDIGAIEIQEAPGPRGQGRYRVAMGGAHEMRSASDDRKGAHLTTPGGASDDSRVKGTVLKPSIEPSPIDVLFAEWQQLFDKSNAHLSPARSKALKRALDEEPEVERLLEALRGFRAHRDKKPGAVELGDIFGTYPGSGDLRSRIEWMRSLAAGVVTGETLDPEVRDRLVEEVRYTLSLPHRPNRQRAEEAWRRLTVAGYQLIRLNERPWIRVTRA